MPQQNFATITTFELQIGKHLEIEKGTLLGASVVEYVLVKSLSTDT